MSEPARFTWFTVGLGLLACLSAFTNDSYTPSLSLVVSGLGADPGSVQLTTTGVFLGFSIGALIHGPLSDRFGRKPVLCGGLAGYALGGVLGALASSLEVLVFARVVQGICISATMVLTRAVVLDRWTGAEASRVISWIGIFIFMAPVIAPLLGGYTAGFGYWPAALWIQAGVGVVAFALTALFLTRSRSAFGGSILDGIRAYAIAMSNRVSIGYMLLPAIAFIGLVTFISTSALIFVDYYGLTPQMQGVCFSAVMIGTALSSYLNGRLVTKRGISSMIGVGASSLCLGGFLVLIASIVEAPPVIFVLTVMIYMFGIGFIFSNAVARAMSHYREQAGAVSSAFAATQYVFGVVVTAFMSTFSTPTLMPLGITLAIAGTTVALLWWCWLRNSEFTRRASGSAA